MDSAGQRTVMGVHLVGSVPLSTAKEVFTEIAKALPGRLRRLPDGEAAKRSKFVYFQTESFVNVSQVLQRYEYPSFAVIPGKVPEEEDLAEVQKVLKHQKLVTGYDDAALESYKVFKTLRSDNIIASETKFQVSLPTPLNVLSMVADGYRAVVEPFYEEAIIRAIRNIEAAIPASDLAIQWDMAAEIAHSETLADPFFRAWYDPPIREAILKRATRLISSVSSNVECGLHLCYGDINHKHFCEPKDMSIMVDLAQGIIDGSERLVNWIHMPVPINRTDEGYFAPLRNLKLGETELFLGLVHFNDLAGTKRRIESAQKACGKSFGIATECGMGRTPPEELANILEISATVSAPYA